MPFPQISYCLICEDVRLERRRLSTVIGLYGVAPTVHILIRDWNLPMERLTFYMLGGRGEGQYQVSAQVSDEQGNVIIETGTGTMTIGGRARRFNVAMAFQGVRFRHAGRYNLRLVVDGQTHYETSFEVSQGQPQDFVESS